MFENSVYVCWFCVFEMSDYIYICFYRALLIAFVRLALRPTGLMHRRIITTIALELIIIRIFSIVTKVTKKTTWKYFTHKCLGATISVQRHHRTPPVIQLVDIWAIIFDWYVSESLLTPGTKICSVDMQTQRHPLYIRGKHKYVNLSENKCSNQNISPTSNIFYSFGELWHH